MRRDWERVWSLSIITLCQSSWFFLCLQWPEVMVGSDRPWERGWPISRLQCRRVWNIWQAQWKNRYQCIEKKPDFLDRIDDINPHKIRLLFFSGYSYMLQNYNNTLCDSSKGPELIIFSKLCACMILSDTGAQWSDETRNKQGKTSTIYKSRLQNITNKQFISS